MKITKTKTLVAILTAAIMILIPIVALAADPPGAGENSCPTPYIKVIKPRVTQVGQTVTIRGRRFGTQEGLVIFSGNVAETVTMWVNNRITVVVPPGATTGDVFVTRACKNRSNAGYLKIGETEAEE